MGDQWTNGQYTPGSASSVLFGGANVNGTGAPGGAPAPQEAAPASTPDAPFISPVLDPVQLGQQVQVPAGGGDKLVEPQYSRPSAVTPGSGGDYLQTGAGQGSADHYPHPASGTGNR